MKKMITSLLLLSSIFTATTTMARSHDNHHSYNQHGQSYGHSERYLPRHHHYVAVDHRKIRHLPQPGRYQRWYRANQQYLLVDMRDHRIIKTYR